MHAPANPRKRALFVSFADVDAAERCVAGLQGSPCPELAAPSLLLSFAERKETGALPDWQPADLSAAALGIPGLRLVPDYVDERAERALVAECDGGEWHEMSRRRVQHQGYG